MKPEADPPFEALEADVDNFKLCVDWNAARRALGYQIPDGTAESETVTLEACCKDNDPDDYDSAPDLTTVELRQFKILVLHEPFLRLLAISPPLLVKSTWKLDRMPGLIRRAIAKAKGTSLQICILPR